MAATPIVRVSIPTDVKETAKAVAAEMGFTLSDIVRLTLTRVAKDRALPLDVKVPNAATRAAMKESRKIMATDITSRRKK
jgi:addiction module antitoxin, RelB/DinJ family